MNLNVVTETALLLLFHLVIKSFPDLPLCILSRAHQEHDHQQALGFLKKKILKISAIENAKMSSGATK